MPDRGGLIQPQTAWRGLLARVARGSAQLRLEQRGIGAKAACRQLSEALCQCITTTIDRDTCLANAANQESRYPPTSDQDAYCKQLLPQCSCFTVSTPEGKKACGLSVP